MATVMYVGTNAGLGQPAAPVWRVVCGVASGEAWCVACGVAWGGGGPCRVACGVMVVCGVWRVVWYAVWCAAWRVACGVVRGEEDRPPPLRHIHAAATAAGRPPGRSLRGLQGGT